MPVPGDEQVVYGRSANALWVSRDAGATWEHSGKLPSRPLSLAVTSKTTGTVFVGTESVGLAVSRDGGETWQVVNDPTLTMNGAAPIAVTALKVNPQDEIDHLRDDRGVDGHERGTADPGGHVRQRRRRPAVAADGPTADRRRPGHRHQHGRRPAAGGDGRQRQGRRRAGTEDVARADRAS